MNHIKNTPEILKSTQPLLYETGFQEWPYGYAGSCFPVRWKERLYIVSAFHCYENHQISPKNTLYPISPDKRNFAGFCKTLRGKVHGASDLKHYDQIAIEVSSELHDKKQLDSIFALDLSISTNLISLSDSSLRDVWLRGFVFDNPDHEIFYEYKIIRQQAYVSNGVISTRKSFSDHCYLVKVKNPIPEGFSPRGMSGSAVYGVDQYGYSRYAGTLIEFNEYTKEYLVIDSAVLAQLLLHENS